MLLNQTVLLMTGHHRRVVIRNLVFLAFFLFAIEAYALVPTATNLWQLREVGQQRLGSVADISLTGVVCVASTPNHLLVLQDKGVTEQVELDSLSVELHPGQIVKLAGKECEVIRRRTGIGLRRLPLVNNDGQHVKQTKSATAYLSAGKYPITVEWFNAGGTAKLSLEYSGPGFARRKIPDALLSYDELSPANGTGGAGAGLKFNSYEGYWRSLPDFGSWPESGIGTTTNFILNAKIQNEHVALVFSGFLTVSQAGNYTFYLDSDDGSKLYLGEARPRIEEIGEALTPVPRPIFVGQIAGTNDPGRWATVEGMVRFISQSGRRLELDLRSPSNNRMQVDIMDGTGLPPGLLLDSKVRLTGVARQVLSAGGQSILGLFTVGDVRAVQLLEVPNGTWQEHPLQTITNALAAALPDTIARVSGLMRPSDDGKSIVLSDDTGSILLLGMPTPTVMPQGTVEALGVPVVEGTKHFLKNACVRIIYANAVTKLPLLTSAQQVLQLPRAEAARGYPVHLRGVITCIWPDDPRNYVLQDAAHGVFLQQSNLFLTDRPQFGEFWDVQGVTGGGYFSPLIEVRSMERMSDGRLPEPQRAEWDQLSNGSLDNQYVEIEGVVLRVETNTLTLQAHSGKLKIIAFGKCPPALARFENKLVRLRGCLQAVWDGPTHQIKPGEIRLANIAINTDRTFAADPFAAPEKTVAQLRLYDLQANAFRRVKISGQFLQRHANDCFMVSGTNGLRFIPAAETHFVPGDLVNVTGVADLRGVAPVLREAVARKTGTAALPAPQRLRAENLAEPEHDATRVLMEGTLLEMIPARDELVLELRAGARTFAARLAAPAALDRLEPGSQVLVTGVYVWQPVAADGGATGDAFELLVQSPLDLKVLSRPPWWTFKKLLLALGILAGGLTLAGVWIVLLRRQVERRTAQLERATRQREQAERARALDEERLRIARDLHDDLGSSLTEITLLGGMSLAEKEAGRGDGIAQIVKKARDSVNALDVIVWAVNPKENTLQSLADYLASFADEFLTASGISCRMNLPVSFPAAMLDGRARHDMFLASKEALHNAVRHAGATEVELSVALEAGRLVITVKDNGTGFAPDTKSSAHGLGNMQGRLAKLGGQCHIDSTPGGGTTVKLELALPSAG